jgi:Zn-dependent protease with chaperone function
MAPLTGIAVALLSLHPEITHHFVPEHCHHGNCASHVPEIDPHSFGSMGLVVAGGGLSILASLFLGRALFAGQRRFRALFTLAREDSRRGCHLLDSDELIAWCCGLIRPKIVVSRGLVNLLDDTQLDIVLAHEAAHAARLDNLRALVLWWATALWPMSRRRIRTDMRDDSETACDAAALRITGDRSKFAETLTSLSSIRDGFRPARALAFGQNDVEARLSALPADSRFGRKAMRAWIALGTVWSFQIIAITALSHYFVELIGV